MLAWIWGLATLLSALSLVFDAIEGGFGSVEFSARLANTIACLAMLRLALMERED